MDGELWVPSANGQVPPGAFLGGVDKDGGPIYVGRVLHDGQYIPAKAVPNHGTAFFACRGREEENKNYEVFCPGRIRLGWKKCSNGEVPSNAFSVGTSDFEPSSIGLLGHIGRCRPAEPPSPPVGGGCFHWPLQWTERADYPRQPRPEPLYVGRVLHDGALTIGRIVKREKCCYISHGGMEIKFREYEALHSYGHPVTERRAKTHIRETREQHEMYSSIHSSFQLCKICLANNKDLMLKPCGHLLCKPCHEWFREKGVGDRRCPFCRSEIRTTEEVVVDPYRQQTPGPSASSWYE